MRQWSTCCFKSLNLMRTSNKSCFAIKRSRFTCANRCCSCFFNSFRVLIDLIWSTLISSSPDIKVLYAWIEVSSCSSTYFSENELSSLLITFSVRFYQDDSVENSQLQAWLHVCILDWILLLIEQLYTNGTIKTVRLLKLLYVKLRNLISMRMRLVREYLNEYKILRRLDTWLDRSSNSIYWY